MSLKIQKGLKICDRLYQKLKELYLLSRHPSFGIQRIFLQFQNGNTYLEKNNNKKKGIKGHIRQSLKLLEKFCFLNDEIPLDKLSL